MFRCCFYPLPHLMPPVVRAWRQTGPGEGIRFLRAQLSAKLAATYATICFRDGQLRCADGTKAFYDLIIPATLDPQSRMTTT